jgi:dihydrofolate reductase
MRQLVVSEFVSLDGVMGEPQDWSFPYANDEFMAFKREELWASDVQLLGRKTYEGFAAAWPTRQGEFADRLNATPKYVVSTTLTNAGWNNSHIIKTNVAAEIKKLKASNGPNILVHGSRTLVQTLLSEGLIDELRLLVYPLVLGAGLRLFDRTGVKLNLTESKAFATGVVALRYTPTR